MMAMKDWSKSSEAFCVAARKGPAPWSVPQMAMPESRTMTVAVSRGPNRNAAQASNGTVRYSNENRPPKTTPATARTATMRNAPSGKLVDEIGTEQGFQRITGRDAKRGSGGTRRGQVGEECSEEHAGPYAGPHEQEGRQGDPRRRPDRCRAGVQER